MESPFLPTEGRKIIPGLPWGLNAAPRAFRLRTDHRRAQWVWLIVLVFVGSDRRPMNINSSLGISMQQDMAVVLSSPSHHCDQIPDGSSLREERLRILSVISLPRPFGQPWWKDYVAKVKYWLSWLTRELRKGDSGGVQGKIWSPKMWPWWSPTQFTPTSHQLPSFQATYQEPNKRLTHWLGQLPYSLVFSGSAITDMPKGTLYYLLSMAQLY